MSRPCTWSSVNAERPATASSMRRMRGRSKRALSSAVTTSGAAVWVAKKSPSAPASRAARAWRAIVSVMASSAGSTAAGSCRRSSTSRSPASLRATVSGEKSVCRIGALSARPRAIRRTASSSRPRAPAPGSSARIRAQSARPCTACFVHCLAPLGEPWYATAHPQSSTQYTPLDITLTKSRSQRRWKASMASASPAAVWSTSGTWRQKETGGRSTGLRPRLAKTRSRLSMMSRSLPRGSRTPTRRADRAAAGFCCRGNFGAAVWSYRARGGGRRRAALPGPATRRRRPRLRGAGDDVPASRVRSGPSHAGQPRRGGGGGAGGVRPRPSRARRVSRRRQALDLALRHHLAAVPQPARLRGAAHDAAGRGRAAAAVRRGAAPGRGARAARARVGPRAGDRRAAGRSADRGGAARYRGSLLRGDRAGAGAGAGNGSIPPAPRAGGPEGEAGAIPSMTCDETRELLSPYLDEALAPDERSLVDAHLEGCAECRGELEALRGTIALLHRLEPVRAPGGFVDRGGGAAG